DAVADWVHARTDSGVLIQSPPLDLPGATRVRLVLPPDGANAPRIVPSPMADVTPEQREMRGGTVALAPREGVTIHADVAAALGHGWDDHQRDDVLRRLELAVPGASAAPPIEEVVVEGPTAPFDGAAAGVALAEVDGVLRPSWFVHAGATATL